MKKSTHTLVNLRKTLGSRGITPELAALWKLQGQPFFAEVAYGEVTLLAGDSESVDHYVASAEGEVWQALFNEIAWVAEEAEGGLIGYFHRGQDALAEAPVVYLDNEGRLAVTGRTLVDHFAWRKESGLEALEDFCAKTALPRPRGRAERERSLKAVASPEQRFAEHKAIVGAFKGPAVRPVDRHPAAVTLRDGRVVIVSSEDDVTASANAAFIYSATVGRFARLPETPFHSYRDLTPAGTLEDGCAVFVKAGDDCRVMIYDPAVNAWRAGRPLGKERSFAGVALLPEGRILVAGGSADYTNYSDAVALYDVKKNAWLAAGTLPTACADIEAVTLTDGRVLLMNSAFALCRIFDPAKKASKPTATVPKALAVPTAIPRALLLPDGRVLMANQRGGCAIYSAKANTWSRVVMGNLALASLVVLADGRVAFFRAQQVTLLDPQRLKLASGGTTLLTRNSHTAAALLPDGRVLLVGGDLFNNIASEPEIWDPSTGTGTALPGFEKPAERQQAHLAKRLARKA